MSKLLVVDDNEQNLYMLKMLLEGNGYQVTTADNGKDALEKAFAESPDMVISDILMPVMDGFTLCRRWKSEDCLKAIPFVFYTATYTEAKDEKLALRLGADRFLIKPMAPDGIIATVRDILGNRPGSSEACSEPDPAEDPAVCQLYNERLVKKLEKKMQDLEAEVRQRRQIETALRESEARYRRLFDSISDCIYTHDLDGRVLTANSATARMIGYDAEELIGRRLPEFLTPDTVRAFEDKFLAPIRKKDTYQGVLAFLSSNGSEHHIEVRGVRVENNGSQPYVSCVGRDITESILAKRQVRKLEKQLFQAQKMEAMGTLAGGIAHDFNNILLAIFGYTELALLDVPGQTPRRQNLEAVLKGCHRAKDLVRQILTFSRQGDQEKKPVNLGNIIKEAAKLLRASLPTTIEMHLDLDGDPCIVEADSTQIHQVLMNLATNAAHAMRDRGGILEISMAKVDLDPVSVGLHPELLPGPYIRMTVSDTGHGIPQKHLARIFDPYFTTKEKGEGTGLGLSVVHGIIKTAGGEISVYSEPEKGTTFHVYLPRVEQKADGAAVKRSEPLPMGQGRILFIDDEPILVDIGKQMLERLGYEVMTRTSSTDALAVFHSMPDQFDLVITDMTMPNLTGDKLAQQILAVRPDIPIILCTGFSEVITEKKAKNLGIRAFIMKPFILQDLGRTVRKVLSHC